MAGRDKGSDHETNISRSLLKKIKLNSDIKTEQCLNINIQLNSDIKTEQGLNINIQSIIDESQRISQLQKIEDNVIDHTNNEMVVGSDHTSQNIQTTKPIIQVRLNEASASSAERGREFRAKKRDEQRHQQDLINEDVTEADQITGLSEVRKRKTSTERVREWRKKKNDEKGVNSSLQTRPKTAAERMREYRKRKAKLRTKFNVQPVDVFHDEINVETNDNIIDGMNDSDQSLLDNSVVNANDDLKQMTDINNIDEAMTFSTCEVSLDDNKIPLLSTCNGFKCLEMPSQLPKLDLVSEKLICPRLPFMQERISAKVVTKTVHSLIRSIDEIPLTDATATDTSRTDAAAEDHNSDVKNLKVIDDSLQMNASEPIEHVNVKIETWPSEADIKVETLPLTSSDTDDPLKILPSDTPEKYILEEKIVTLGRLLAEKSNTVRELQKKTWYQKQQIFHLKSVINELRERE